MHIWSASAYSPAHIAAGFDCLEALDFLYRHGCALDPRDVTGEMPCHKAARGGHNRTLRGLKKINMDFGVANVDEDSTNDIVDDKSRFWKEGGGESMKSLRELAKMRRDGKLRPTVVTYSTLIAHCAAQSPAKVQKALFWFGELRKRAIEVRRQGYRGMLAIHPAQVPVINEAFTPSDEEVAEAREIVDLFEANPGAGTIGWKGGMLDRPHLSRARQLLAQVED